MAFQLLRHGSQVVGQPVWALGTVTVHLLHLPCQPDQLGQLLAVYGVVTLQDVVHQRGVGSGAPVNRRAAGGAVFEAA